MYLNQINLIGNIGKDPEFHTFEDGNRIAKFSLATSRRYKTNKGETREDTYWHNIVVKGKAVDFVDSYLHKGDTIFVSGEVTYRSYQTERGTNNICEIISTSIQPVKTSRDGQASEPASAPAPVSPRRAARPAPEAPVASPEDLPF